MRKYIFEFTVCPMDNSWWSDYRNESVKVNASNTNDAVTEFLEVLSDKYCMYVSNNARKTAKAMYLDVDGEPKQVGYVFTASTDVMTENYKKPYVKKYAKVWAEVHEVVSVFN